MESVIRGGDSGIARICMWGGGGAPGALLFCGDLSFPWSILFHIRIILCVCRGGGGGGTGNL